MTYAYDNWVLMPTKDLYDTSVMQMAIAAAKDMYDKGEQQIKDFRKEFGDFMSPLGGDMAKYNEMMSNVYGRINDAYAHGVDLLKSPEGRMIISLAINSINPAEFNNMRLSAANAQAFLKAKLELLSKGLYSPELAALETPDMSTYSTSDNGVWDMMSPTPYQNPATFSNPYFEGVKPNIRKESRNGIEYDVESITMDDLKNIANSHFNELVNTPQGRLMYQYYQNITGNDLEARDMFNNVIADSQRRRVYEKSGYDDYKNQTLQLQRHAADLSKRQFEWQQQRDAYDSETKRIAALNKGRSSSGADSDGESLLESIHHDGLYNAIKNRGVPVIKLVKKNGRLQPTKDKNGNVVYINPDDASYEELEYSANNGNALIYAQGTFAKNVYNKYNKEGEDYTENENVQNEYINNYGFQLSNNAFLQHVQSRKVNNDGSITLSIADVDKLRTTPSLISTSFGSLRKYNSDYNRSGMFGFDTDAYNAVKDGADLGIVFQFDDLSSKNAIQLYDKNGKTQVWVRGSIQYTTKSGAISSPETKTVDNIWFPIGVESERAVKDNKGRVLSVNSSLNGSNRTRKNTIDANYIKSVGGIKNINAAE